MTDEQLEVIADTLVLAAPAAIDSDDPLMKGLVTDRARSYLVARFTHSEGPPNRNGHLFRTKDLEVQHKLIPGTPMNMMHRTREVVGTFMRSGMVYPAGTAPSNARKKKTIDRVQPRAYQATPWVKTVSALWAYHFPEETQRIRDAYEDGKLWVSQESLPASVTCPECNHNAPWQGYRNPFNCDHMNQPRAARWMERPHFLGGGIVIPPWQPGWKDAHVETFDAIARTHPEAAESIIAQLAETAPHLSDRECQEIAGQLLGRAVTGDVDIRHHVAPMFQAIIGHYDTIDFRMPDQAVAVVAAATAAPACLEAATAADLSWCASVTDGMPRTPAGVRRLAAALDDLEPGDPAYLLRGGQPAHTWASDTVAAMDALDEAIAALLADATKSDDPDARLAAGRAGEAMPDGSFHIVKPEELTVALKALNAARTDKRAAIKAHLLARARELNAPDELIAEIEQLQV